MVNMKGTRCPRCSASDDGPLPVYKKNFSPLSYASKIKLKSLKKPNNQSNKQTKEDPMTQFRYEPSPESVLVKLKEFMREMNERVVCNPTDEQRRRRGGGRRGQGGK